MSIELTVTASEFKAKCLGFFDQLAARKLTRLSITKRGRVVAVMIPPEESNLGELYGFMRGSVVAPPGFDFTGPALDEPLSAETGRIHE